jgi:hypothetical protein
MGNCGRKNIKKKSLIPDNSENIIPPPTPLIERTKEENTKNILFIIEVNVRSEKIICANVEKMSEQKDEAEILFNIGSVFRIIEVKHDNVQKLWKVYMKATEDGIITKNALGWIYHYNGEL